MNVENYDNQTIEVLNEKIDAQSIEIDTLKSALADVLSRLHQIEEYQECVTEKNAKNNGNKVINKNSPAAANGSKKLKPLTIDPSNSKTKGTSEKTKGDISESNSKTKPKTPDCPDKPKIVLAKRQSSPKKRVPSESSKSNVTDEVKTPDNESVKFQICGRQLIYYIPSDYCNKKDDGTLPDTKLELHWVYGYRGKDSRNNLFQLGSGEIVYNMAGVVVIYDILQKKQRFYLEHTDDIRAIAIHPNQKYMASGQVAGHSNEDGKPHIRIWNPETLATLCSFGHGVFERGVSAIEFLDMEKHNHLLVIDEVNIVYLYDWMTGELIAEAKGSNETIFGIKKNLQSSSSFVSYGKSHLGFWTIRTLENKKIHLEKKLAIYDKVAKPKFALNVVFTDEGHVISGDSNGNILLFQHGSNRVSDSVLNVHKGGVVALVKLEGKDEFISCGKYGQITSWNSKLEKIKDLGTIDEQYGLARIITPINGDNTYFIGTSRNCILEYNKDFEDPQVIVQGHSDEMWGLAAHPNEPLFVTCSQEKLVCLWNSEEQINIWSYFIEDSAVSASFHPNQKIFVIGTNNGKLYLLNYEIQEEIAVLPTSRDEITDVEFSPDGNYIAATCRDSNIYLYSFPEGELSFKKPKILKGHSSRVLHIDWSADSEFLQSNASDYDTLYWHVESGLRVVSPNAMKDTEWKTWTTPFGFPVMGIWPEGADGTDINACSRSHHKDLIASGDDFGQVKLFRYPSVKLKSEGHVGTGHSSHVTCVRFLKEDSGLVTVGGKDASIMQWKLVPH